MQIYLQSTRRNNVELPLLLFAKHGKEVRNIHPLPVPKCKIDLDESWHTDFIDYYLNVEDFSIGKEGLPACLLQEVLKVIGFNKEQNKRLS